MAQKDTPLTIDEIIEARQPLGTEKLSGKSKQLFDALMQVFGEPRGQTFKRSEINAILPESYSASRGRGVLFTDGCLPSDFLYDGFSNSEDVVKRKPRFLLAGDTDGEFRFLGCGWRPTQDPIKVYWRKRSESVQIGWYTAEGRYERFGHQVEETSRTKTSEPGVDDRDEGLPYWSWSRRRERKPELRQQCLDAFGDDRCQACPMDWVEHFDSAELATLIDVHHRYPLQGGQRSTNPAEDLIPLCPTCHRVAHRLAGKYIELPELLRERWNASAPWWRPFIR